MITFSENTIGNSTKVPRAKSLGSDGLFCFNRICKFESFKNLFATITSLSELYFTDKKSDLYELWELNKQLILTWYLLDLTLTIRHIYINSNLNPLKKFNSTSRSTLSLKISSHGTSLKWSWRPSQSAWE